MEFLISEFHFLRPLWLLAVPLVWWMVFLLREKWWQKGDWDGEVEPHLLEFLATSHSQHKRKLLPWVMCLAGTLLLLSLAGPAWQKKPQPLIKKSQARVLVLDLSFSMLASDVKPTRIDRVRFKLEDLLNNFSEGETAIVGYAGEAFVISPLTHDANTISSLLPGLHPNIMPVPGSRADLGVELASDLLSRSIGSQGHIILVTDGIEESEISAVKNASGANEFSILAVGTEAGSPIALKAGGFLKDRNGAIVIPKLNLKPLRKLANQVKGRLTLLSPDDRDVNQIIAAETSEGSYTEDEQQRTSDKWNEEGPWLLLIVLPLTALLFRRGVLFSIGLIVLPAFFALPDTVRAFSWDDLWLRPDQQAAELFHQGETDYASKLFEDNEWKATAAYRSGDFEKAAEQFAKQDNTRANFNRGNALAFAGRLQDAIDSYEKVLSDNPQHKDAKFNKKLVEDLLKKQNKSQQNKQQQGQQNNKQDQSSESTESQQKPGTEQDKNQSAEKKDSGEKQHEEGKDKNNQKRNEGQNEDQADVNKNEKK
ncbi:MAG: VWA domain-containing protein, partial [SAR324 cluster bacterium]|nr:VWA domain-containing protein [SAR324 cluster bacterium]